jgi:hypothetical protein
MSDSTKESLRKAVRENLDSLVSQVNQALRGVDITKLETVLARIARKGVVPHWYAELASNGALPNLDGKTIGSVVEMLFVAVLETAFMEELGDTKLRINPARGVDLPDLDLGVKSPSENFCTSEPFYSAYERLLGGEYDILVLLTDYQDAKKNPPLRLQIKAARYLFKTQVADESLCSLARKHRAWLLGQSEPRTQKFFRFLAYVNQSDWSARQLLKLFHALDSESQIDTLIGAADSDFKTRNAAAKRSNKELIPELERESILGIRDIAPRYVGVIEAADNWMLETWKEAGRSPNENEWRRLKDSPLDGAIGMSFALQWRYNFARLFGKESDTDASTELIS